MISKRTIARKVVKIFGTGESSVQDTLSDLHGNNSELEIAYQARRGEVWVKLTNKHDLFDIEPVEMLAEVITRRLGHNVFGFNQDSMESAVARMLIERGLTISLAESCTGGLVAKKLTDLPGSSDYLMYGVVSYSNEAKMKMLGVRSSTLSEYGAVSGQTAVEMAEGVRKIGNTDLSISITGIAGPGGGSEDKPVGLVYIALASPHGAYYTKNLFYGDRENIRELTARTALNMVRLYILDQTMT